MSWVLSHRNLYIYHIVHRKFHAHIDAHQSMRIYPVFGMDDRMTLTTWPHSHSDRWLFCQGLLLRGLLNFTFLQPDDGHYPRLCFSNPFPHLPPYKSRETHGFGTGSIHQWSLRRYYSNLIGWFHPWNLSYSSGVFQRYVCMYDYIYMYVLVIYNGKSDITARAVSTAHCSPFVSFLKWVWKEGTVAIKLLFNHKLYWVDHCCDQSRCFRTGQPEVAETWMFWRLILTYKDSGPIRVVKTA